MKVRVFLVCVLLLFLASLTVQAAAPARIVILRSMPVPVVDLHAQKIIEKLQEYSRQNQRSIQIVDLQADGDRDRARVLLAQEMQKQRPDLVISVATLASQEARKILADTSVPQLFCVVADPVGAGLVERLGVPSKANISGFVYNQRPENRLEIVTRLLENTPYREKVRFGVISSDYPSAKSDVAALKGLAALYPGGLHFENYMFPYRSVPAGLPAMFENMRAGIEALRGKVDFLWEVSGPLSEVSDATRILLDSGIPLINGNIPASVEMGGLIAIQPDYDSVAAGISDMAWKSLNGVPAGDLPVTVPDQFKLYLNMATAKRLGINVPSHLMMMAGENLISGH